MTKRPVLYFDDVSPPVRSCLLLIKMLDIDVECKYVDLFKGGQFDEEFLKINPAHTVPTLVDGDLVLTDSHVILMHFCEKFEIADEEKALLLPKTYEERMRVINMMFFECSVLFRRDSDFLSEVVRKGFANVDLPYHKRKILEAYAIMETILQRHKFMAGDHLTLADICILTTLSTVDLMFPVAAGSVDKWPLLHEWFEGMKLLPEYSINQKGLESLRIVVERIGDFKFETSRDLI